ncbi:CopG family transcriptional regulator [Bacillus wiedmannii]|uniref:CopG family transcriptional regulator n=1 Tax=Bacillus cereus group TaxID=86661 RepID=UPI000BF07B84|nr:MULTISPECIES: CopG family transcriptional regulator [Bacillus cereus group]MDI6680029.1 CopG family transcriptional regulator [Bacillus wiedmannii]MED1383586.1 CopG family transcriptional regulator [Bacillus mycoides]PEO39992.1 CopG family transcriptional regulator [Bacillus wiedmannii]
MKKHGGKREGAGRPTLGITRKVSITLSEEHWKRIQDSEKTYSEFFRKLTLEKFEK